MKFDDVLMEVGQFGPYQRRVYCLAAAPALLLAFETLSVIFIFHIPQHSVYRAESNMISELGTVVGTIFCGFLADRFGRKITFYVGALALIGGGFGIAFTNSLITLNICRFILGIARMATWINGFVIGMEIVGPSKRTMAGMAINGVWCAGELILLLLAYFVRHWRYLEIAVSVPSIGLLFYWWLMPESPRWLASRGRTDEAMKIIAKIAQSNKKPLPKADNAQCLLETEPSLGYIHIFKSRELVLRMVVVFTNMFVIVIMYYGLTLNITNLSGNLYKNFALNVVLEILAYVSPYFLLDRLGRKPVFCGSMLLAGAACVFSVVPVLYGSEGWVVSVLSSTGRFMVSVAFAVIYLYGAELFPTVVRTSTMGLGVTFSRVGNIISPFLADMGILVGGKLQDALPLIVMGTPAIIMGLMSLWLPETLGVKLPETVDDLTRDLRERQCPCSSMDNNDNNDEHGEMNSHSPHKC